MGGGIETRVVGVIPVLYVNGERVGNYTVSVSSHVRCQDGMSKNVAGSGFAESHFRISLKITGDLKKPLPTSLRRDAIAGVHMKATAATPSRRASAASAEYSAGRLRMPS